MNAVLIDADRYNFTPDMKRAIERAIWEGDTDTLDRLARCRCCCHEHTFFPNCPAAIWHACRGQCSMTDDDIESWVRHYERHHGMTRDQFFGEWL